MPAVEELDTHAQPADVAIPHDVRPNHRALPRVRACAQRSLLRAMVPVQSWLGPRRLDAFGILMYHRTTPRVASAPFPTWNVTPRRFRQQMEGLLKRGFTGRSLRDVIALHRNHEPIPPRTFVVTFDDGYQNNYLHARPILEELGIPATIFVATAYLDGDGPFPSDDWPAAGSSRVPSSCWGPLTTEQCAAMLEGGLIDIGTHTHTHDDFRGRPAELEADLRTSLGVLQSRLGLGDATFAFPYGTPRLGFCSPQMTRAARRAGVLCSLTTESAVVTSRADRFAWGRFAAEQSDTAATLAAKLDGWYSFARDAWHSFSLRKDA